MSACPHTDNLDKCDCPPTAADGEIVVRHPQFDDEAFVVDPRDVPHLPDQWGYGYVQPRFMSPYTKRGLAIALIPIAFLALLLIIIGFVG